MLVTIAHEKDACLVVSQQNAYHRLVELGADVIPLLASSFSVESDSSIRSALAKIAWRTNSPSAIPFLAEALDDDEPDVWKEALDGLVSLGGRSALAHLSSLECGKFREMSW
jgi:HEAT repeat protein